MGAPLVYGRPDTIDGFLYVVFAAQFVGDLVNPFGDMGRKLADLAAIAGQQLGILAPLVPAAFVVVAVRRPRLVLLTGTWLLVTCWFAASYTNADIERYYLGPALIVITWLGVAAGLVVDGLAGAAGAIRAAPGRPAPPRAVALVLGGAVASALVLPAALAAPATAAQVDQSRDTAATDWSRWVLGTVESDAVIVSWWSYSTPLWYRTLVLRERPDVRVVDDRDRLDEGLGSVDDVLRANLPTRPVYVVPDGSKMAVLEASWRFEVLVDPTGRQPLYRVLGPRTAGSAPPMARSGMVQPPPATMAP
jgi:hypothetical protein